MIKSPILVEHKNKILFLTFNRPDVMNVVDGAMSARMLEIGNSLSKIVAQSRVIVLRSAGASFMAGGDIRSINESMPHADQMLDPLIKGFHVFIEALANAPQIVLCAVQGAVAGGGFSLAIACDLVIAADNTMFVPAYAQIGTSADGGATYTLPRAVGLRRAMELLLLCDRLDAEEALALGLVNRVVALQNLEAESLRIAEKLVANSVVANASTKRLLRESYNHSLTEQLTMERDCFVSGSTGPDFTEGVRAFLEKRRPNFKTSLSK